MRTKTALITAALSLTGVATSMAQVYSINAVGYINLTLKPGFNMVANQLNKSANNTLTEVFQGLPEGSQALKFDSAVQNYVIEFWDAENNRFVKEDGTTAGTLTAAPGDGLFLFNGGAANATVTLVGEVPQGSLSVAIPAAFSLIATKSPQALQLTAANQFPQEPESQFFGWNADAQNYTRIAFNDGTRWVEQDGTTAFLPIPAPAVGEGFFYFNSAAATAWVRDFSVN
jgi:hypothetical protein